MKKITIDTTGVGRWDVKELLEYLRDNSWDFSTSSKKIIIDPHNPSRSEYNELNDYIEDNSWKTW